MNTFTVGVNRIPPKSQPGAVFMDTHGADTTRSVSGRGTNQAGFPLIEVPEGQVLTWAYWADRWLPIAEAVGAGAVTAANVITMSNARRFTVGDVVYIPGVGYRTITSRDDESITVDGAAITISAGAKVLVDHGLTNNKVASQAGAVLTLTGPVTGLKVGMKLKVGDGKEVVALTPVVANAALYALKFRLIASGKEKVVPYTSDGSATAKEIVEGVGAAVAADSDVAALVSQSDDDALLYLAFEEGTVEVEAITANFNAAPASRTGTITAINTGTKAVTLNNAPVGVTAGDTALGFEATRHYRLTATTVPMANLAAGYVPGNVDIPTRPVGEVRERLVNGLTADARAKLAAGGIRFNPTSY